VSNRGIGRARMFMGALLLLAAVVTWSIGLTMSPHGETVARGTDYVRTTVVTFKRNGALGTVILCAVAAWLLFPSHRPKWPARDWALKGLLASLLVSSIYTLIWLPRSVPSSVNVDENLAIMNLDSNVSTPATNMDLENMNTMLASEPVRVDTHTIMSAADPIGSDLTSKQGQSAGASATGEQVDADGNGGFPSDGGEPANNDSNRE
jgi:hypothetical protein